MECPIFSLTSNSGREKLHLDDTGLVEPEDGEPIALLRMEGKFWDRSLDWSGQDVGLVSDFDASIPQFPIMKSELSNLCITECDVIVMTLFLTEHSLKKYQHYGLTRFLICQLRHCCW